MFYIDVTIFTFITKKMEFFIFILKEHALNIFIRILKFLKLSNITYFPFGTKRIKEY